MNLIKRGVLVVVGLRVLSLELRDLCKTLFQLLEVNFSTEFDGRLHEKDFRETEITEKLKKVIALSHDTKYQPKRVKDIIWTMGKMFDTFGRPFEALGNPEKDDKDEEIWSSEE